MTYKPDSSGWVTTPPHMRQVADRMGSISQRAMLCHRGHHEVRLVLRWLRKGHHDIQSLGLKTFINGMFCTTDGWSILGEKCKHCGRWV